MRPPIHASRTSTTTSARAYAEEVRDLAAAGCRYLQIDEVNFAYLCDAAMREEVRTIGEDPATLPRIYARLINDAIAGRPQDMTVCLHLCRGNFESAWLAEGGYEPVADVLFNEVEVDGYFLEYDSPRAGDFAPLRFVPKGKRVVLGLVTTKHGRLEEQRRAEAADRRCGPLPCRSSSWRSARSADLRAASVATSSRSRSSGRSSNSSRTSHARSGDDWRSREARALDRNGRLRSYAAARGRAGRD